MQRSKSFRMQQIGPAGESASYGKSSAKSPRGLQTRKVFPKIVAGAVQWPAIPAEMCEHGLYTGVRQEELSKPLSPNPALFPSYQCECKRPSLPPLQCYIC
ncbi:unnamed protein product [Ixodes pacificus]